MSEQQYYLLTGKQMIWIVTLRVLLGWHFLYEGLAKVINPNWSSMGYLLDSGGWFSGIFTRMATSPQILDVVDVLNVWGLIAVGAGLILGLFEKPALWGGILLLSLYYLSHPPLTGIHYSMPLEGNYLIVNKVLIELAAFAVLLVFPSSRRIGIDRIIFRNKMT